MHPFIVMKASRKWDFTKKNYRFFQLRCWISSFVVLLGYALLQYSVTGQILQPTALSNDGIFTPPSNTESHIFSLSTLFWSKVIFSQGFNESLSPLWSPRMSDLGISLPPGHLHVVICSKPNLPFLQSCPCSFPFLSQWQPYPPTTWQESGSNPGCIPLPYLSPAINTKYSQFLSSNHAQIQLLQSLALPLT